MRKTCFRRVPGKADKMKDYRTEPDGKANARRQSSEAELFAEILARMDEKQRVGADGASAEAAKNAAKTIDLVELFYYLLSKLYIIVLGMVVGGLLLGAYASARITPIYTATSKLYIMGESGINIMADLQIGSALTMDYQEVFRTWEVHQMVNDELGMMYDYSVLQSMLTVTNPENSRILYITVRHPDAQTAAEIANAYATAAKRFITMTMNTDEPSTFSIALVPGYASNSGVTSYVIRGILLGTVLAGGLLVLIFLLDSRPKSPEDIMRYANLPTLAVIPANPSLSGSRKRRGRARRR